MTWFYAEAGQQKGPVSQEEFDGLVRAGSVRDETLVWREGMANWQPYGQVKPPPPAPSPDAPVENVLAPAGTSIPATIGAVSGVVCCECGLRFPAEETIRFGDRYVCATCKPRHVQRLREGATGTDSSPHGHLGPEELLARGVEVEPTGRIGEAWTLLTNPLGVLLGGGAVVTLIILGMGFVPYLGGILSLVFTGPLTGGLMMFFLRRIRGETVNVGDAFGGFGPRFGSLLLAYLLPAVLIFVCMLPIIIPAVLFMFFGAANTRGGPSFAFFIPLILGFPIMMAVSLYLYTCWMYALPLVADKKYDVWPAMQLSRRAVRKNFWPHLGLAVLNWLILMAGFLALCLGYFVAAPLVTLALTLQYHRVFRDLAPQP